MNKKYWVVASMVVIGMETIAPAFASEMVYHPVNPTFGGNPLNGTFLLSTAQAQGEGVKSGPQGPDLSGLTNALSNPIIIDGAGGGGGGGGGGGNGGTGTTNNIRNGGLVP